MLLTCTLCGEEYWPTARILQSDANAICTPCFFANFAGAQPPIDAWGTAREALEVYVFDVHHPTARQMEALRRIAAQSDAREEYVDAQSHYRLTPRQQEAMARLQEAWRRQEEREA